jgi:hypothetical protein
LIRHLLQLTPNELDQMKALNPKTKKDLKGEAAFGDFLLGNDAAAARIDRAITTNFQRRYRKEDSPCGYA